MQQRALECLTGHTRSMQLHRRKVLLSAHPHSHLGLLAPAMAMTAAQQAGRSPWCSLLMRLTAVPGAPGCTPRPRWMGRRWRPGRGPGTAPATRGEEGPDSAAPASAAVLVRNAGCQQGAPSIQPPTAKPTSSIPSGPHPTPLLLLHLHSHLPTSCPHLASTPPLYPNQQSHPCQPITHPVPQPQPQPGH